MVAAITLGKQKLDRVIEPTTMFVIPEQLE